MLRPHGLRAARHLAQGLVYRVTALVPPPLPRQIGLFEVLLYPFSGTLDWMRRHALIIAELERIRSESARSQLTVLDFGGGGGALATALRIYGRSAHYRLVLADIDSTAIATAPVGDGLLEAAITLEPGGCIPLPDRSVDAAVSCDVFEHIPAIERPHWASELQRVARSGQVHSFPADSPDLKFASTAADRELDAWYRQRYGEGERWTSEHLAVGEPDVNDLARLFGPCVTRGFGNVGVWSLMLRNQLGDVGVWSRAAFGVRYLLSMRGKDRRPPFKACLLVAIPPLSRAAGKQPHRQITDRD